MFAGYGKQIAWCALLASMLVNCNDVPVDTLQRSLSVKVLQSQSNKTAVKVDFLWVLDNSSSMCHEQKAVASSANEFMEKIEEYVNIDYRIAVVTTDVKSSEHLGKFRHHRTDQFPWACREEQVRLCLTGEGGDVECQSKYGRCSDGDLCEIDSSTFQGDCDDGSACVANGLGWKCGLNNMDFDEIKNCNDSINSQCQRECESAAECEQEFTLDDPSTPDINESSEAEKNCLEDSEQCHYECRTIAPYSACILRPESAGCPSSEEMRQRMLDDNGTDAPYLTPKNATDLFKCIAIVGAEQSHNARNEEAFNAALLALDKKGPNAEQAKTFLRDDAYLVIIFVSDEDDGSAAAGCAPDDSKDGWNNTCISADEAIKPCKYLKSVGDGKGKLGTVSSVANALKALKSDPGRILVASIVGDSLATDPATIASEREAFKDSQCGGPSCDNDNTQTKICYGPGVDAEYGERYIGVTERFGLNGIVTNICAGEGIVPALDTIAIRIVKVISKLCLPYPIEEGLVVRKLGPKGKCPDQAECTVLNVNGCGGNPELCVPEVTELEEGDSGETYKFIKSADCMGTADQTAIYLNFEPEQGLEVEIEYIANPLLNGSDG